MDDTFICASCGEEFDLDDAHEFNDQMLCPDCYDSETVECSHCGERIATDDNAGTEDTPLCQNCYDEYYYSCADCGRLLCQSDAWFGEDDEDETYPYCESCYNEHHRDKPIHSYSYKPEPVFYGEGSRFFGVELEIDEGGKLNRNAAKLLEIGNAGSELIYIKGDGSLDDGIEIVTHPMTLGFHKQRMPWKKIMNCALSMGYYSHKTDTCGLHVHVNRDTFTADTERQEECISRILFFVERFWEELLRFSRRTESQVNRWAARYGYKNKPKEILEHAKKGYGGRYTCVNITNYATIEFRIFRGTLKWNTLIATLQLVNEICNVAFSLSDEELAALSWCEFVENLDCDQYPELITYLKERRLYVNEPVCCEEDD